MEAVGSGLETMTLRRRTTINRQEASHQIPDRVRKVGDQAFGLELAQVRPLAMPLVVQQAIDQMAVHLGETTGVEAVAEAAVGTEEKEARTRVRRHHLDIRARVLALVVGGNEDNVHCMISQRLNPDQSVFPI